MIKGNLFCVYNIDHSRLICAIIATARSLLGSLHWFPRGSFLTLSRQKPNGRASGPGRKVVGDAAPAPWSCNTTGCVCVSISHELHAKGGSHEAPLHGVSVGVSFYSTWLCQRLWEAGNHRLGLGTWVTTLEMAFVAENYCRFGHRKIIM